MAIDSLPDDILLIIQGIVFDSLVGPHSKNCAGLWRFGRLREVCRSWDLLIIPKFFQTMYLPTDPRKLKHIQQTLKRRGGLVRTLFIHDTPKSITSRALVLCASLCPNTTMLVFQRNHHPISSQSSFQNIIKSFATSFRAHFREHDALNPILFHLRHTLTSVEVVKWTQSDDQLPKIPDPLPNLRRATFRMGSPILVYTLFQHIEQSVSTSCSFQELVLDRVLGLRPGEVLRMLWENPSVGSRLTCLHIRYLPALCRSQEGILEAATALPDILLLCPALVDFSTKSPVRADVLLFLPPGFQQLELYLFPGKRTYKIENLCFHHLCSLSNISLYMHSHRANQIKFLSLLGSGALRPKELLELQATSKERWIMCQLLPQNEED